MVLALELGRPSRYNDDLSRASRQRLQSFQMKCDRYPEKRKLLSLYICNKVTQHPYSSGEALKDL